ncbi:NAD(+) diphosphatase [Dermacoccaceae bacterium W4C1]
MAATDDNSSSPESLMELTLSRTGLDRAAMLRRDPQAVTHALADPRTRVLDLYGDRAPFVEEADGVRLDFRDPHQHDGEALALLLGQRSDQVRQVAVLHPAEDDGGHQRGNLRRLGTVLQDADVASFVTAVAMANWHSGHDFCPNCGNPTVVREGGWVRVCEHCGRSQFPRTDPAVIMSVIDARDRLLLAQGAGWPQGRMSVLAGFVEPGESLEAAVAREVAEEVGVGVRDVRYRGNQPWPFPASLMLGFTATAEDDALNLDASEIADARWFTRAEVDAALVDGSLVLPGRLSIARHLIEAWYGSVIDEPNPPADPRAS